MFTFVFYNAELIKRSCKHALHKFFSSAMLPKKENCSAPKARGIPDEGEEKPTKSRIFSRESTHTLIHTRGN